MAEAMFAKAGKGYNKEQVDAFLIELNASFAEKEEVLEARVKQLEAALAESKAALAAKERECTSELASCKEALEAKAKECEALQASIGQRMIAADSRAEEILFEAEEKAEQILADARERASAEADRMIGEIRRRCSVIGQTASDFTQKVAHINDELRRAESQLLQAAEESKKKAMEQTV